MEIYTDRLKFSELTLLDISTIAQISQDMAWNDTINLLARDDLSEAIFKHYGKGELYNYKEKLLRNGYNLKNISFKDVPQDMIPQNIWHINFPQLSPPFLSSAQKYVNKAIEKRKETERQGYWLAIREINNKKLIGVIAISTKSLKNDDGKNKIGHAGMFLHPDYQKKGIVSEANAVMIDFMYKYLFDKKGKKLDDNTFYYTTCNPLNIGSQKMQEKAGGILDTSHTSANGKFEFYASRKQQENSRLFNTPIKWTAYLDDHQVISSQTGSIYPLNKVTQISQNYNGR